MHRHTYTHSLPPKYIKIFTFRFIQSRAAFFSHFIKFLWRITFDWVTVCWAFMLHWNIISKWIHFRTASIHWIFFNKYPSYTKFIVAASIYMYAFNCAQSADLVVSKQCLQHFSLISIICICNAQKKTPNQT